jgi:transcription termination factor Rho
MAPMKIADAAETLIERMEKTADNKEFLKLITTA